MNTETDKLSLKDLNIKCKNHAVRLLSKRIRETVYLLDLGAYNSAYIIPKGKVTQVMAVIESLEKVQISTLDPSLNFGDGEGSLTLMYKDLSSSNPSLTMYKKGKIIEIDSFQSISKVGDDFYEVRSRNADDSNEECEKTEEAF